MFVGHFALGFAAKRATPKTSLVTLFVAAQLADILWPIFLALGIEQVLIVPGKTATNPFDFVSYPYSHSLLMLAIWGAIFGGIYFARTKNSRGALIICGLVISHWVLDWIVHIPDMPLWPGGPKYGLGLWNSPLLEQAIELAMYVAGFMIYARSTRATDKQGTWGFRVLILLLLGAFLAGTYSPAPSSVRALWITAMLGTLVTLILAWWTDRHRASI
jgi:membrane-bound metal-dependent hydrolase YbcI (DUF457 family)